VDSRAHRADVVDALPDHAPPGYLIVTAGDPNLYIGAGPNMPLRRVATIAANP
jgi:hypothetical protein